MKRKNKLAEQREAKNKHKEQQKAARRVEPNLERSLPQLTTRPSILIVCEGENTEPSYFNQFRLSSATIRAIGKGYNTLSLVKSAQQLSAEKKFDQVWCVFDKDDHPEQNFNNAIKKAQSLGFAVAYSNQAFEYWLILHFEDHQGGGLHRRDYSRKINALINPHKVSYDGEGCKIVEEEFFELLNDVDASTQKKRVTLAIERAKRNHDRHQKTNPALAESSSTVFNLVSELLKYI